MGNLTEKLGAGFSPSGRLDLDMFNADSAAIGNKSQTVIVDASTLGLESAANVFLPAPPSFTLGSKLHSNSHGLPQPQKTQYRYHLSFGYSRFTSKAELGQDTSLFPLSQSIN